MRTLGNDYFYLGLMLLASLFLMQCTASNSDDDSRGDKSSDTDMDTDTDTDTEETTVYIESDLPIPTGDGVEEPSGNAENLKVLDWAGFSAALSYTFDDTQPSQVEHYNELQATGVRMTFFANNSNSWIKNYVSTFSQAVMDGHEIGNHTVNHCHIDSLGENLTECDGTPAEEITECTDYIEENFGQDGVYTFAAPYGDSGWANASKPYVFLNRTVSPGTIAPNGSTDAYRLPSKALTGEETTDDINALIDPVHDAGEWLIFCFHSILPTSDNWWAGVDIESITGSIAYAQSAGDIWIDSMVNVGAYWLGQKLVTDATPKTDGDATVWTWTLPDNFPPGKFVRVTVDGGTLSQNGRVLEWDSHGYYEVSLSEGALTLSN
jgi:hypothetical protein